MSCSTRKTCKRRSKPVATSTSSSPPDFGRVLFEIIVAVLFLIVLYSWRDAMQFWYFHERPDRDTPAGHFLFTALLTLFNVILFLVLATLTLHRNSYTMR